MELSNFSNGIESHNRQIAFGIEANGLHVVHETSKQGGYSYTVGLSALSCPELIIFGCEPDKAEEIFVTMHQGFLKGLIKPESDKVIANLLDKPMRLIEFTEMEKRQHFYATRTYLDTWQFKALKMTYDS